MGHATVASRRSCIVLSLFNGILSNRDLEECAFCCRAPKIEKDLLVYCRLAAIANKYASDMCPLLFHRPISSSLLDNERPTLKAFHSQVDHSIELNKQRATYKRRSVLQI